MCDFEAPNTQVSLIGYTYIYIYIQGRSHGSSNLGWGLIWGFSVNCGRIFCAFLGFCNRNVFTWKV